ncbi:MAG: serine/threonine protein kinase [Aridibacter famidurans]|nr:serine/threonine protein kinase [Aridibacter famidurans]
MSISDTSAPTSIRDEDHTPTKLKETKAQGGIHTTSSDGARFVAGHVLAERYRIVGLIGRGGMGEVYKAEDLKLEQTVALKFLPEDLSRDEEALKRFVGEVRSARQVSHPNVCRVFDMGDTDGLYYISMEFIEGDDLSMLLNRIGRLPSDKAVEVSRQICLGLAAIHKAGILHRDLKPANIIIDSKGEARITDFGIAGIEADVQGPESRVGTPAYMSPEQITGKEVTQQSDIYSLGLLLYEIFTGKQAFEGKSFEELIRKHQTTNPTTPSQIVTGIDPLVENVIEACIRKDPLERPSSALKVAMSLPGGDPLQVALEAGETPTPEMVAAAPEKGLLKPRTAVLLLAGFFSALFVTAYLVANYTDASWSPLYKSAEVLREEARSKLDQLSYGPSGKSNAWSFETDRGSYDFYITSTGKADSLERYRTGQPHAVYFWYRQSIEPLIPDGRDQVLEDNPPRTIPGSEYVKLDPKGRLVELLAAPMKVTPDEPASDEADWPEVFRLAGLDISKFRESESQWTPPVFADNRKAWEGFYAEHSDFPIRVEAASFEGRPVYFKIVPPWEEVETTIAVAEAYDAANLYLIMAFVVLIAIGAGYLSIRNVRAGRIDLKGATRVGIFVFAATGLVRFLRADHMVSLVGEFLILAWMVTESILTTATILLLSVAVEPLVRRWWPELLISWNRLIAGEFRDPIIGRDLLIGMTVGLSSVTAFYLAGLVRDYLYGKDLTRQGTMGIDALNSVPDFISYFIGASSLSIFASFGILTLLLVSYLIFRKKLIGVSVLALFWALFVTLPFLFNRGFVAFLIQAGVVAVFVFVFARFGLLTILASTFVGLLANSLPFTFDPARPYFGQSLVTIGIIAALGCYAFYISLGKQKLFEGRGIEELTG